MLISVRAADTSTNCFPGKRSATQGGWRDPSPSFTKIINWQKQILTHTNADDEDRRKVEGNRKVDLKILFTPPEGPREERQRGERAIFLISHRRKYSAAETNRLPFNSVIFSEHPANGFGPSERTNRILSELHSC